jgi:MoxR-like ATPase
MNQSETTGAAMPDDVPLESLAAVRRQIATVIVGQEAVIDLALCALLIEGHVLLEGVPGLGKTMLIRSLAEALSLRFSRIQFTPDLMPADVVGSTMAVQRPAGDFELRFENGPVFANLVLADEINRASPKTQSALLEAMQERAVTVRGARHALPRPFQVLATQNPLEMEGTYPLPEAQLDRFAFKVLVAHPSHDELVDIVERTVGAAPATVSPVLDASALESLQAAVRRIVAPRQLTEFAVRLTMASQPERGDSPARVRQFVRYGAGPRATQTLVLGAKARALMKGRLHAGLEDLLDVAAPAMRHRMALNFDGLTEGLTVDTLLDDIIRAVKAERDWDSAIKPE